uniref:Uncharacterized protein n=1 Tax=Arundo donax TaxID=35708 RepID=A0A0A9GV34_ARUDO
MVDSLVAKLRFCYMDELFSSRFPFPAMEYLDTIA